MDDQTGRSYGDMVGAVRPRRRRWVRSLLTIIILAALAVGAWYGWQLWHRSRQPARPPTPPPQSVGAATVGRQDVRVFYSALGTVTSLATVTVKTQIAGKITQIAFTEGQLVKPGDFLIQIDPRPYQVALENAEGAMARDQAQLKNAQLDLIRYKTLLSQDSVSKQQVDTQAALVRQYEGTIKTDQATVDSAQLNLVYCHIVSPVGGRVGLRQVDIGNYVQPSDANGLVVVAQISPISVVFALPEDDIPQIQKAAHANPHLPAEAWDRADQNKLEDGELASIDNQVDTSTGTVKLRATFANPDELLFPNQFVNARLLVDTLKNAIAMPTAAIQRGEPGTFVYLIGADDTVHVQKVKLGPVDGTNVAVLDGLKDGDKVVTDGADRLRDGAKVAIPAQNGNGRQRGGPANAGGTVAPPPGTPTSANAPAAAAGAAQANSPNPDSSNPNVPAPADERGQGRRGGGRRGDRGQQ